MIGGVTVLRLNSNNSNQDISMLRKIFFILLVCMTVPLYSFASSLEANAEETAFTIEGDVKKGKSVFKKCKACHQVKKEKNGNGPHLVGVLGRDFAAVEGYKYSKALQEATGTWTPETLAEFLKKPKDYLPGNKMAFGGLKKDKDIANVIAYLNEFPKVSE